MSQLVAVTWNVENTHAPADVRRELAKIIRAHNPDVIALQETYHLHDKLDGLGYRVIQYVPRKRQSERAECALLIRDGIDITARRAMRMHQRWRGPKAGKLHDPRIYRWARIDHDGQTWKVASVHLPFGAGPKRESERRIRRWFRFTKSSTAAVVLGDWNEVGTVVARRTARPVGAKVIGARIDHATYRNAHLVSHAQLGRHGSDHHAQKFTFTEESVR